MSDVDVSRQALLSLAVELLAGREVDPGRFIEAGLGAVVAGLDAPSLPLLAGADAAQAPVLFERVVDELGLDQALPPDAESARWVLVRGWLSAIVRGELRPGDGGVLVREMSGLLGEPGSLGMIVRWTTMLDTWITTDLTPRDVCEVPILEQARELLGGHWPPR
ncbi:hypothetical protein [Amycolatopsis sp. H20-H5]|uniref:hypothetical protein n=1 Tax=Amycolatopsis sp. H20-H5 TaxID=3046309 RepID=UPI002DB88DFD|nr:hypothetical protein [Amycolatopsis sp. H20-H5]MEC3981429.1 hypothetical protein [Amycolatopsis sp. H20-H5]